MRGALRGSARLSDTPRSAGRPCRWLDGCGLLRCQGPPPCAQAPTWLPRPVRPALTPSGQVESSPLCGCVCREKTSGFVGSHISQ